MGHAEPAEHGVQLSALGRLALLEKVPAAHGCGVAEPSTQNAPDVQSMHAVLPDVEVNLPAGQSVHVDCSANALNEPGRHGVRSSEPTLHEVPSGQTVHSSSEPRKPLMASTVWLACVPPGHGCGADEPSTHR